MNQKRALGVLLLLLLLAIFYAYWQTPRQERVGPEAKAKVSAALPKATKIPAPVKVTGPGEFPRLRSDLLDRSASPYPGVRRDLFYSAPPAPLFVAPAKVEPLPPPPPVEPPPPPPGPTREEVVARELARFKFLGFVKKEEQKTIFLGFEGDLFLVRQGDRFGRNREFLVTALTASELKIRQEEVGEIVIPLIDQAPLSPSSIGSMPSPSVRSVEEFPPPNPVGPPSGRAPLSSRRGLFPGAAVENQPNEDTQDEEE